MKPFDPSLPITVTNWPPSLRMPPKKAKPEKPTLDDDQHAPWWRD